MMSEPSDRASPERPGRLRVLFMLGLGGLAFGYAFFQRVAPSVMVEDLMHDFNATAAVLGNLSAFYFYAYASLQIPVGVALDRWGPRRMLSGAFLIGALGSAFYATAETLYMAYLGRLLIGGGAAVAFLGTLKLATYWMPPQRFSLIAGTIMLMGMTGGVVGQAPLAAVVEITGWRPTMVGAAVFAGLLGLLFWLVVKDAPRPPAGSGRSAEAAPSLLEGLGRTLKTPQIWLIALFAMMMSGPSLSFGGLWGVPYLMQTFALDRPTAATITSTLLIGWAVGGPLGGWLSDYIGRRKLLMIIAGGSGLMLWTIVVFWLPALPLAAVYALFFVGNLINGFMVVVYATARENAPLFAAGAVSSVVNFAMVLAGAIFQPVIGILLDLNWQGGMAAGVRFYSTETYAAAFLIYPICAVVALGSALLSRETYCRQQVID